MRNGQYSDEVVHFEMLTWYGKRDRHSAHWQIGFADFLIDSWRFMFKVEGNSVLVVSENVPPGSPMENLGTFGHFLERYATNPAALRIL